MQRKMDTLAQTMDPVLEYIKAKIREEENKLKVFPEETATSVL